MNVHVMILAAGNSRRFGGNKLLHLYKRKPLYRYMLETILRMDVPLGEKMIVTQYDEIMEMGTTLGYYVFRNECPEDGISRSIRIGITELMGMESYHVGDAVMCCVCDQPELRAETLTQFVREYKRTGRGIGVVTTGEVPGNPVIFRDDYWEELKLLSGDEGGKAVRNRHPEDVFYFPVSQKPELWDIDEREDMEKLERV